jgi:hypothetical protein
MAEVATETVMAVLKDTDVLHPVMAVIEADAATTVVALEAIQKIDINLLII